MRPGKIWLIGFILTPFLPLPSSADDHRSHLPSAVRTCAVCHGVDGISHDPNIPNLAGQDFKYLVSQTARMAKSARRYLDMETREDLRSAAAASHWAARRDNHAMDRQAATLDDAAIEFAAKFFASRPRACAPADVPRGTAPPLVARCAACHGENGVSRTAGVPHLAGQKRFYLTEQLRLFRADPTAVGFIPDDPKRSSSIMGPQAAQLSKQQAGELAAWYANAPCPDPSAPEKPKPGVPALDVRDGGAFDAPPGQRGLRHVPCDTC